MNIDNPWRIKVSLNTPIAAEFPFYDVKTHDDLEAFLDKSGLRKVHQEGIFFIKVGNTIIHEGVSFRVMEVQLKLYEFQPRGTLVDDPSAMLSEVHMLVYVEAE